MQCGLYLEEVREHVLPRWEINPNAGTLGVCYPMMIPTVETRHDLWLFDSLLFLGGAVDNGISG